MQTKKLFWLIIFWVTILAVNPLSAQNKKMKELEKKIDILAEEIDMLKSGKKTGVDIHKPKNGGHAHGLEGKWEGAPAASKVYEAGENKTTIGGYGELHYNNARNSEKADKLDLHRVILYLGHRFNDWIIFNSELEVEHAGNFKPGNISFEQAYIDFLLDPNFNVRAGLLLVPMGIVNEIHEPPTFHGVERPDVEKYIIPTTWRENGIGIFGRLPYSFQYRFYLINGGDISKFSKPSDGIRQTRQKGFPAKATDFAFTGKVSYSGLLGLKLGASFYTGNSSQENNAVYEKSRITMWSADARYNRWGLELTALYAGGSVSDTDKINAAGGEVMGKSFYGWYAQIAYNVFSLLKTTHYLAPFFRYEQFDTQRSVAAGYTRDLANKRTTITLGLTYRPIPDIAIKGDYQFKSNGAGTEEDNYINLGIGYMF